MTTPTTQLEAQWREEAKKVWTEQGRAHWVNLSDFDSFAAGYRNLPNSRGSAEAGAR